jgi:hypothetical protein
MSVKNVNSSNLLTLPRISSNACSPVLATVSMTRGPSPSLRLSLETTPLVTSNKYKLLLCYLCLYTSIADPILMHEL